MHSGITALNGNQGFLCLHIKTGRLLKQKQCNQEHVFNKEIV